MPISRFATGDGMHAIARCHDPSTRDTLFICHTNEARLAHRTEKESLQSTSATKAHADSNKRKRDSAQSDGTQLLVTRKCYAAYSERAVQDVGVGTGVESQSFKRYVQENFACQICMESATSYLRCPQEHLICTQCFDKYSRVNSTGQPSDEPSGDQSIKCPTCKTGVIHRDDKARTVNDMLRQVCIFRCPHEKCPMSKTDHTADEIEAHRATCSFREVQCPFRKGAYMCTHECHGTYCPGSLLQHIKDHHSTPEKKSPSATGASMYDGFVASICRRCVCCAPHGNHNCQIATCPGPYQTLRFDVNLYTAKDVKDFEQGTKARMFTTQVDDIIYTLYITCRPTKGFTIITRGDYPLGQSGRPLRIRVWYPNTRLNTNEKKKLQTIVANRDNANAAVSATKRNRVNSIAWVDYGTKRIECCPSFSTYIRQEHSHIMNVDTSDVTTDALTQSAIDTGDIFGMPFTEYCNKLKKPCFSDDCKCLVHFRIQVEFL